MKNLNIWRWKALVSFKNFLFVSDVTRTSEVEIWCVAFRIKKCLAHLLNFRVTLM